jgi:hypothetical protein
LGKKPADQASNQPNGSGDAVDLETELDDDASGTDSDDEDDDDADGGQSGAGGSRSIEQQIADGIAAALPSIQASFQSEIDRRVNGALNKVRGKAPAKKDDDGDGTDQGRTAPVADVRGARIAFREYLPDTIKLLGPEERSFANDYGQNLIRARAHSGFDDEDQTGREVAEATAEQIRKLRSFYSARTKRVLEAQGALVAQGGGQAPNGTAAPSSLGSAFEAAQKKDRELFPHRYADKQ